eukprot:gene9681-biopygen3239
MSGCRVLSGMAGCHKMSGMSGCRAVELSDFFGTRQLESPLCLGHGAVMVSCRGKVVSTTGETAARSVPDAFHILPPPLYKQRFYAPIHQRGLKSAKFLYLGPG